MPIIGMTVMESLQIAVIEIVKLKGHPRDKKAEIIVAAVSDNWEADLDEFTSWFEKE